MPGALWNSENLEATRVTQAPAMQRIVVAIDPSGSGGADADECGIIVAGLGQDGEGHLLADLSGRMSPTEWARRAVDAYRQFKADRIVCEVNYGGAMVTATIASIDPNVPCKAITSSRGKVLRAEPISTIFEQGRAHLVGSFPELEDQMTSFTSDYDRVRDGSPDRVDALVFAFTELMCDAPATGYFSINSLLVNGAPVAIPKRPSQVFAVGATPGKSGESLGVVYFAYDARRAGPWPLVIVDYDLRRVDEDLFEQYLAVIYTRLADLARTCAAGNSGLWLHGSAGVGAALLQQAAERGLAVHDIDQEVTWAAAPLADRAAAASRHLHTGRRVKIAESAFSKLVEHRGFTRNHLIAEFSAFRLDEELESDALLRALLSGVRVALDDSPTVGGDVPPAASPGFVFDPADPKLDLSSPTPWRGFRVA